MISESDDSSSRNRGVLDPTERFSEVVFGVIMAMTFTGTLSVATAGEQDIREMLYAVLGCNLAWGIVDGVLYVITSLADRGWRLRAMREISAAKDAAAGRRIVAEALPGGLGETLSPGVLEEIRAALVGAAGPSSPPRVTRADVSGAVSVFSLVVLATLPVALPFVLFTDVALALRVSNGVALGLLFLSGSALGHYAGFGGWRSGFTMLGIGVALVAITIALGG